MVEVPKERKPTFLGRQELDEEKRVDFLNKDFLETEKRVFLELEEDIEFKDLKLKNLDFSLCFTSTARLASRGGL